MKLIVAVSGGVDSVVLLDMLVKQAGHQLTVAHFDHGMRQGSAADARFVAALAASHGVEFVMRREELGEASEDEARQRRYGFLFEAATDRGAKLVTAHHLDDLVETIAINVTRGTRWRGLAVFGDKRIWRPLAGRTKSELENYAIKNRLEWVEDETNRYDIYQRNRLRKRLATLSDKSRGELYNLWLRQGALRHEIEREKQRSDFPIFSRYFMTMIDEITRRELLYDAVLRGTSLTLLSSQLDALSMAVRVGRTGTAWQIGQGVEIDLSRDSWRIK